MARDTDQRIDAEHHAITYQLMWFQRSPAAIAHLLRRGGSILLAAKILVICRLLHKALSHGAHASPVIDNIRNRLASLRGKLLRRIDAEFCSAKSTVFSTLESMCAFLLATSLTPVDVMRHYLHVRLKGVQDSLKKSHDNHLIISKAFNLYLQTLHDTRALIPTPLADLLVKLKSRPLVDHLDLRNSVELDLEVDKRWLPEELRNFVPWLRHDSLHQKEVDATLGSWSTATFAIFVQALHKLLDDLQDLPDMTELRKKVVEVWFHQRRAPPGDEGSRQLVALREAFNDRMKDIIRNRARRLDVVGKHIYDIFRHWNESNSHHSPDLWAMSIPTRGSRSESANLKKGVLDSFHGRIDVYMHILDEYQKWLRLIKDAMDIVKQMRDYRWNEDLDLEEEDENLAAERVQLIRDDPSTIEDCLGQSVTLAFESLQDGLQHSASTFSSKGERCQAALLLRIIRDIRAQLPQQGDTSAFGLSLVHRLHGILVQRACDNPLSSLQAKLSRYNPGDMSALFNLWDGSPLSPVQPSPSIFKFIYDLVSAMTEDGGDLWTENAVHRLKSHVRGHVSTGLGMLVLEPTSQKATRDDGRDETGSEKSSSGPIVDGDAEDDGVHGDRVQDTEIKYKTQVLFDILFLQAALKVPCTDGSKNDLALLEQKLLLEVEALGYSSERLHKNAQEFWKRTCSLFTLLA